MIKREEIHSAAVCAVYFFSVWKMDVLEFKPRPSDSRRTLRWGCFVFSQLADPTISYSVLVGGKWERIWLEIIRTRVRFEDSWCWMPISKTETVHVFDVLRTAYSPITLLVLAGSPPIKTLPLCESPLQIWLCIFEQPCIEIGKQYLLQESPRVSIGPLSASNL